MIRSCKCRAGFMPENSTISCDCTCDTRYKEFSSYIKECDSNTSSVIQEGITYIPILIMPVWLLSFFQHASTYQIANGSDTQCDNDRGGLLRVAFIKPTYSLSLGRSKCLEWPNCWYANLYSSDHHSCYPCWTNPGGLASIADVIVAVWTLSSYANIISVNSNVHFRHPHLAPTSTFISWLNL